VVPADLDRRELLIAAGAALAGASALGRVVPAVAAPRPRATLALVTADTTAQVVVVSLLTGRVVRRIRTTEGPRSIQADRGHVLVGHADAGVVTVIEGRPAAVRRVLRGFVTPRYAAFAPGGRHAFVSDGGAGEIAVVDVARARVIRRLAVGDGARHLSLSPDGRRLWVALGTAASALVVVDVSDPLHPRVHHRLRTPFLSHDVAVTPDGSQVWLTAAREGRLAVLGAGSGAVERGLHADRAPQHVTFGPGRAYVASGEGRGIRVHDLRSGRLLRSTHVAYGSYNVQRQFGHVLSPSLAGGTLSVLGVDGRMQREVQVAPVAHDACAVA
jgi:DNA-binding beta-propeller fold protein YncE